MNIELRNIVNDNLIHITALQVAPRIGEHLTFKGKIYIVKRVEHVYATINKIVVHLFCLKNN